MSSDFEPIDLDEHMRFRAAVLTTWEAWDEQPGNDTRANAYVDACVACFGAAHNDYRKLAAAVRRAGGDRTQALDQWESDW